MFSCRAATQLMTEAREGALTGARRVRFATHLVICKGCRAYRRQLDLTVAVTKEVPREEVPVEIEDRLVAAFRAANPTKSPPES